MTDDTRTNVLWWAQDTCEAPNNDTCCRLRSLCNCLGSLLVSIVCVGRKRRPFRPYIQTVRQQSPLLKGRHKNNVSRAFAIASRQTKALCGPSLCRRCNCDEYRGLQPHTAAAAQSEVRRNWLLAGVTKGVARATYLGRSWSPPDKLKLSVGLLFADDATATSTEVCNHIQQQQCRQKCVATDCRPV